MYISITPQGFFLSGTLSDLQDLIKQYSPETTLRDFLRLNLH
ncbi:MAG: hypothetical protein PHD40_06515 [Syntrophomonadaceae bacterium]|nr:hypothetical protein [Syntrophomonadaceae bacterium]